MTTTATIETAAPALPRVFTEGLELNSVNVKFHVEQDDWNDMSEYGKYEVEAKDFYAQPFYEKFYVHRNTTALIGPEPTYLEKRRKAVLTLMGCGNLTEAVEKVAGEIGSHEFDETAFNSFLEEQLGRDDTSGWQNTPPWLGSYYPEDIIHFIERGCYVWSFDVRVSRAGRGEYEVIVPTTHYNTWRVPSYLTNGKTGEERAEVIKSHKEEEVMNCVRWLDIDSDKPNEFLLEKIYRLFGTKWMNQCPKDEDDRNLFIAEHVCAAHAAYQAECIEEFNTGERSYLYVKASATAHLVTPDGTDVEIECESDGCGGYEVTDYKHSYAGIKDEDSDPCGQIHDALSRLSDKLKVNIETLEQLATIE